ncbi:hypothetical protein Dsin_001641 [Dipteronia sinensis]|uniref:RNase H type-1 domain-containing protein n=1 Tax=Dipteronia sinensis TaxID=43782 RepID=A0AAE0B5P6_9ROSI|nr:hypothetical protein Dsin_001641 [Dipteronia sinensis]
MEIKRLCARFWWGNSEKKEKMHWCSWPHLCLLKGNDGLGFCDLKPFNRALLGKQCWRILRNPNTSEVILLKGSYFPRTNFLQAEAKPSNLMVLKSLIWGKCVIEVANSVAILRGLQLAIDTGFHSVVVESDATVVVGWINDGKVLNLDVLSLI